MNTQTKQLTSAQWIDKLAQEELPAITSIASILDKFSKDDVSSIPKLSKFILHDQALSSSLLKVANNVQRGSLKQVTTVTRAAIVLGVQAVKNVCITAKILDRLLQNKNLLPEVYNRLMHLMANAFYAGHLAKMMVPHLDDDTQEQVYLAAMLYHIGESTFWSTGSALTEELIEHVSLPSQEFEHHCAKVMGVEFNTITAGLAKTWNLGELLVKSLDKPESRTVEMNVISLSNQLSAAIASPPRKKSEFDRILKQIETITNLDTATLRKKIEHTRLQSIELLNAYETNVLESYLLPLPKDDSFAPEEAQQSVPILSSEQTLIQGIKQLSSLSKHSNNLNEYLMITLPTCIQAVGLSRCTFWVLDSDKSKLQSRASFDEIARSASFTYSVAISQSINVFNYVVQISKPILVNEHTHPRWRDYINPDIEKLINKGSLCIAPVRINNKVIGVISGQRFGKGHRKINEANYSDFCFLVDHLSMCLASMPKP